MKLGKTMKSFQSKYKSIKTIIDSIKFDSKAEAKYYLHLKEQEKLGYVKIIELQPKVYLTEARILYKPDFLIKRDVELIYIDVKGMTTPVFAIKKRLWKFYGNGTLEIVKRGKITEVVKTISI